MPRNVLTLAAGSIALALLAGCSLSSPDQLPKGSLSGDTHLTILQTTDIHDHAAGDGPMLATQAAPIGSYARIATYVNSVRTGAAADHPVVLVDSGDWTMGTLYDLTIGSQPLATFFLDTLRYDCATLGNHEFDYTPKGLASLLAASQAKFGYHTPIVASNTVLNGNTDLAPYMGTIILPTYTQTLSTGLKVGYLGLMGKDAASDAPASAPVAFTDYSKNYASIQALVDGLHAQGCHVVVALSHAGTDVTTGGYTGEDIDLAKNVKGIDVIASGHTHNPFADGAAAHAVPNGTWTTQVICAGAYSKNVSRVDLTYHFSGKFTTLDAASNKDMTDATLAALPGSPVRDGAQTVFQQQADASLNIGLAALFTQFFPDYNPSDLSKGVYHPIGFPDQDMVSNDQNAVLCPNGLGNLCADSVRNVPNAIIFKSLLAAGWNGDFASPTLPAAMGTLQGLGYDPTPYTAGIVPTGVIRDYLGKQVPVSFANAYDILPLGITPDTTQAIPVGYPLMSVYLTYADVQKVCALQLLAQTNLTPSNYYLNLSGLSYALDANGSYDYFKHATAAAVLKVTQAKAGAGSPNAIAALTALATLGSDNALMGLYLAGTNPYATAMVNLNDATPDAGMIGTNLGALGAVAGAGQYDAAHGTITLYTLILGKAIAAVGQVSAFAPTDAACTGPSGPLSAATRTRVAGDLYAIMMMGALEAAYGVNITAYAGPSGATTVSAANLAAAMANRINLNGPSATVQEMKEWMALVVNLITPPEQGGHFTQGEITGEYLSTANFLDFGTNGAAVTVRNASYPIASIGPLMGTLHALTVAP